LLAPRLLASPARCLILPKSSRCIPIGNAMMAAKILQAVMRALALGVAAAMAHAQAPPVVEPTAYVKALAIKDSTKRAQALEVFIAWYPYSPLRIEASEQAMT